MRRKAHDSEIESDGLLALHMPTVAEAQTYREVLVFAAGMTPQIITETIYALTQAGPKICPDEIYVITTSTGKKRIIDTLLGEGILDQFSEEYGISVRITDSSFLIPRDAEGVEIEDIRNSSENEAMGDLITTLLRKLTADPTNRLHCSIAGGRKTMSFYLGAALQLFGRPWDRLYHVLVTPEFESNPQFYYKPRKDCMLQVRLPNGTSKKISTKYAKIQLAELPFIRLRGSVTPKGGNFRGLVSKGQQEIDTAELQREMKVSLRERSIHVAETSIRLTPVQLMIYVACMRQKMEHCVHKDWQHCRGCTDCFIALTDLVRGATVERAAKDYAHIYGGNQSKADQLLDKWGTTSAYPPDIVRQHISKLNRAVECQLGAGVPSHFYKMVSVRQYGNTRYGIYLDRLKMTVDQE